MEEIADSMEILCCSPFMRGNGALLQALDSIVHRAVFEKDANMCQERIARRLKKTLQNFI